MLRKARRGGLFSAGSTPFEFPRNSNKSNEFKRLENLTLETGRYPCSENFLSLTKNQEMVCVKRRATGYFYYSVKKPLLLIDSIMLQTHFDKRLVVLKATFGVAMKSVIYRATVAMLHQDAQVCSGQNIIFC